MSNDSPKRTIRRAIKHRRAQLTDREQSSAAKRLSANSRYCLPMLKADRVLSYAPFAGEISPYDLLLPSKADIYLPRISNYSTSRMLFHKLVNSHENRWGIREPDKTGQILPANAFRVILLPLVAFDRSGTRLGMGAGFYDRALASLSYQHSTRPYLLGLAHHFQEVNSLVRAPWDVPLDAILTDREFIEVVKPSVT